MSENKVQFNLKNVHYAKITAWTNGVPTYATPVAVNGAVSLSLEPQGEMNKFYADGLVYYTAIANNGYEGDLEMARFPDQMLQDIWGFTLDATAKTVTENAETEPANFALLFEIDGDADEQKYTMYSCVGTRPAISGTTNAESKDVQTQSSTITAAPLASGKIFSRTTAETPSATSSAWFSSVTIY